MNRILTVYGQRFSVPRFVHRKLDNGGGWSIALPGVQAVFTDAQAGSTEKALQLASDLLAKMLQLDTQALLHYCTLQLLLQFNGNETNTPMVSVTFLNALLDRNMGEPVPLASNDGISLRILTSLGVNFNTDTAKTLMGRVAWDTALNEWLQVLKNHMQSKQTIYPNTQYVPTPSRKAHTVKRQMPVVPRRTPSPQIQLNFA